MACFGVQNLQGTVLDGHALELKRSAKRLTKASPQDDEVKRSKLIIRNIPFQVGAFVPAYRAVPFYAIIVTRRLELVVGYSKNMLT